MGSLTFLNSHGDVTILWEPAQDEAIAEIIRKKMEAGVTFFIVEPVAGGLAAPKKTKLSEPEQAMKNRALVIDDEDLTAFVGEGKATLVPTPKRGRAVRRSKDPQEVAQSSSVAVKPRRGG